MVTDVESERLTTSLERLQAHVDADIDRPPPGTFRKELVGDSHAPELARAALLVTAAGAPDSILDAAELLTSGLVTNSVKRANGGPVWLAITLHPDVLRVEVADGSVAAPDRPPAPNEGARWSFMLAAELATRWGSGRETGGTSPGSRSICRATPRPAHSPTRSGQASAPDDLEPHAGRIVGVPPTIGDRVDHPQTEVHRVRRCGIGDPDALIHHLDVESAGDRSHGDVDLVRRRQTAVPDAVGDQFGQEQHDAFAKVEGEPRLASRTNGAPKRVHDPSAGRRPSARRTSP